MAAKLRPKVGIGILIFKDGKVLLGKRKESHGKGEYVSPGGHLEFGESIKECAKRECFEEAGIRIKNIRFLRFSNMRKYGKHYADIGLVAEWGGGKPKVKEPEKMEKWEWHDSGNLPKPLFGALNDSFESLKTDQKFFDS